MTLQYMCTMTTEYYHVALVLHDLSAAFEEKRSKANLSLSLPLQCTCGALMAGKAALPGITGCQVGICSLRMPDTGTQVM